MPEWAMIALAVVAVPLSAILGGIAIVGLAIWVSHRNRMAKLQIEEKERQAEMDRELLGLGSREISANLETLLQRMGAVESRLENLEAMTNIEVARTRGRIPIAGTNEEQPERRRDTDTERA